MNQNFQVLPESWLLHHESYMKLCLTLLFFKWFSELFFPRLGGIYIQNHTKSFNSLEAVPALLSLEVDGVQQCIETKKNSMQWIRGQEFISTHVYSYRFIHNMHLSIWPSIYIYTYIYIHKYMFMSSTISAKWQTDGCLTPSTHRPISTHIGTICKAASVAGLTEGKILYSFVLICRFWFNAIFLNTDRSVLFDPRSSGSLPKGLPLEPALRDIQSFVSRRELFQFSGIFRPITFPFFFKESWHVFDTGHSSMYCSLDAKQFRPAYAKGTAGPCQFFKHTSAILYRSLCISYHSVLYNFGAIISLVFSRLTSDIFFLTFCRITNTTRGEIETSVVPSVEPCRVKILGRRW